MGTPSGSASAPIRDATLEGDPLEHWLMTVLPTGRSVAVDLGCGTGRHAVLLAEHFHRVVAVDVSEPMVTLARERRPRPNVDYLVADVFDVTGSFDYVFSSAMLHHVTDLDTALRHIRSLVAPGGRAVLVDVIAPSRRTYRIATAIAPYLLYRTNALAKLLIEVARRRADSLERYRLHTYRPWLDHLATDRFLTAVEFDERYGRVFTGATFVPHSYFRACMWDAPP
jgi:ubiquinone/menaquinone biosynthesis C-methylase UbiE